MYLAAPSRPATHSTAAVLCTGKASQRELSIGSSSLVALSVERMTAGRIETMCEMNACIAAGRHVDRLFADRLAVNQQARRRIPLRGWRPNWWSVAVRADFTTDGDEWLIGRELRDRQVGGVRRADVDDDERRLFRKSGDAILERGVLVSRTGLGPRSPCDALQIGEEVDLLPIRTARVVGVTLERFGDQVESRRKVGTRVRLRERQNLIRHGRRIDDFAAEDCIGPGPPSTMTVNVSADELLRTSSAGKSAWRGRSACVVAFAVGHRIRAVDHEHLVRGAEAAPPASKPFAVRLGDGQHDEHDDQHVRTASSSHCCSCKRRAFFRIAASRNCIAAHGDFAKAMPAPQMDQQRRSGRRQPTEHGQVAEAESEKVDGRASMAYQVQDADAGCGAYNAPPASSIRIVLHFTRFLRADRNAVSTMSSGWSVRTVR